jgi:hypothetical protein
MSVDHSHDSSRRAAGTSFIWDVYALAFGLISLGEVFPEATEKSESPMHAAMRRVKRVLQRGTVAQLPLSSLKDGVAENKEPRCAWRTGAFFRLMPSDRQCITPVPG